MLVKMVLSLTPWYEQKKLLAFLCKGGMKNMERMGK